MPLCANVLLTRPLYPFKLCFRLLKGSKLCLVVGADNPSAIALYRKMGYREEGRLEGEVLLPTGEVIDLIAMAKFI